MALITDPLIINWDNTRVRPMCDAIVAMNLKITQYMADYAAQGIAAAIATDGATEFVADGSLVDGRAPITGTQIVNLEAALSQLSTALNTTLVSGVGTTVAGIVNAMHVISPV